MSGEELSSRNIHEPAPDGRTYKQHQLDQVARMRAASSGRVSPLSVVETDIPDTPTLPARIAEDPRLRSGGNLENHFDGPRQNTAR